ncbi:MAG: DoxX family protein [Myxococcales bacterium]
MTKAALWILQVLLALHTAMGALWKLSNSVQTVPSLSAIPQGVWLALSGLEALCVVALLAPAVAKRLAPLAPLAAAAIATEMVLFTAVHLATGHPVDGQVAYWAVVAVLCAVLALGRAARRPAGLASARA